MTNPAYDLDDQFIDALARGQAPSSVGADPVGQLLSSWAAPIHADAAQAAAGLSVAAVEAKVCLLYTSRCV